MFITAQFTLAKSWNQLQSPLMDEYIKKMCHIYTVELYPVIKKNEIMFFCRKMNGPREHQV